MSYLIKFPGCIEFIQNEKNYECEANKKYCSHHNIATPNDVTKIIPENTFLKIKKPFVLV